MSDASPFKVVGKRQLNKPFLNNILSTNICLYKYLANLFFDGDMERIVWASTDMMFRRRIEQLAKKKLDESENTNLGILEMPFCSFRLTQDGIQPGVQRSWWNPVLHTKGVWINELGKKVVLTPVTLNYEACFCCTHDSDLYWAQQENVWDANFETILESFVDAQSKDGEKQTLKNIVIFDASPHVNNKFAENDWLEQNKIQTITLDIACETWLIADDRQHKYSLTKTVLFDFLQGANYHNLLHQEGDVDEQAEQVVWDLFMGNNVSRTNYPIEPENMVQLSEGVLFPELVTA